MAINEIELPIIQRYQHETIELKILDARIGNEFPIT